MTIGEMRDCCKTLTTSLQDFDHISENISKDSGFSSFE